jgi:hypothetical protein
MHPLRCASATFAAVIMCGVAVMMVLVGVLSHHARFPSGFLKGNKDMAYRREPHAAVLQSLQVCSHLF